MGSSEFLAVMRADDFYCYRRKLLVQKDKIEWLTRDLVFIRRLSCIRSNCQFYLGQVSELCFYFSVGIVL